MVQIRIRAFSLSESVMSEQKMLSKKICKTCCSKDEGWKYLFSWRWNKDYVLCPYSLMSINVKQKPPAWCPYALEHLMKVQKNVK